MASGAIVPRHQGGRSGQGRKRRRLSIREGLVFAKVTVLLCLAKVAVVVLPLRTVQKLNSALARRGGEPPVDAAEQKEMIVRAARAMGWRLFGNRPCLPQALVVHTYLRRLGFAGTLHLGVTLREGKLLAHAWVEEGGKVVIGGADSTQRYAPLYRID